MKTKIQQSLLGGIVGTIVMTAVMFIAPLIGMHKMNPAAMLSMMMGFPIIIGWIMHFMIGTIFATAYVFLFFSLLKKIKSNMLKGAIFGLIVFIFAQIIMALMGAILGGMPPMEGSMILVMMGSLIGHLVFGITVALFVKD
jgi:hypothetical protein